MPFDGTTTKPSLTALAEILRDHSRWPEGFVWNYNDCRMCAMGMAHELWRKAIAYPGLTETRHALRLDFSVAKSIFYGLAGSEASDAEMAAITPEQVADAIDEYLARGK